MNRWFSFGGDAAFTWPPKVASNCGNLRVLHIDANLSKFADSSQHVCKMASSWGGLWPPRLQFELKLGAAWCNLAPSWLQHGATWPHVGPVWEQRRPKLHGIWVQYGFNCWLNTTSSKNTFSLVFEVILALMTKARMEQC